MAPYLKDHHTISIIGIAKNAGKTTVLNRIIDELQNKPICITSIGLDGEKLDNITRQEKPRIKVYKGMYVVTAEQCLIQSTAKYIVHEDTQIRTALGNIIVVEIIDDGLVLVAGPSSKQQMIKALDILKKYKPYKIFIDGALFRKSIATTELSDGIIFVTGASYSNDMDHVVKNTKTIIDQLSKISTEIPCKLYENMDKSTVLYSKTDGKVVKIKGRLINEEKKLLSYLNPDVSHIYIPGAFTDRMAEVIIKAKKEIQQIKIFVRDASFLLQSENHYENLRKIGVEIHVLNQIEILFVAYNPTSPFNYSFKDSDFRASLRRELVFEPINVLQDLG